jgi:sulfite reductase (ferredoxin)
LNFIYKDMVPAAEIVPSIVPVLVYFKQARENGESLGDFCHRKGLDDLLAWTEQYAAQSAEA